MKACVSSVSGGVVVIVGDGVKLKLREVPEGAYEVGEEVFLEIVPSQGSVYKSPRADKPFKAYPAVPPQVIVDMPLLDDEDTRADCDDDDLLEYLHRDEL